MRQSRPPGPPPARRTPRSQRIIPDPRPLDPRVPIECKLKLFPEYTYFNWLHVIRNICEQLPLKYFITIGNTTHGISTTWRANQEMGKCSLFFLDNLFLQFEYNSSLSTLSGQLNWTGGNTFQWKQDKERGVEELELRMDLMILYHMEQLLSKNPGYTQRIQEWKNDSLEKLANYHRTRVTDYFKEAIKQCAFFRRGLGLDDNLENLIITYSNQSDRFEFSSNSLSNTYPFHFYQQQTHKVLAQKSFEIKPYTIHDNIFVHWFRTTIGRKLLDFHMTRFIKPRLEAKNWQVTVEPFLPADQRPSKELSRWKISQFNEPVGYLSGLSASLTISLHSCRKIDGESVIVDVDFYNLETLEQTIVKFLELHKYYVLDKMKKELQRKWEYYKQHPGFIPNKPASSPPQEHPGFMPSDPASRPP